MTLRPVETAGRSRVAAARLGLRSRSAARRARRRAGRRSSRAGARRSLPGSLFDRREGSLRALLRVPARGERAVVGERPAGARGEPAPAGRRPVERLRRAPRRFAEGFEEARQALFGDDRARARGVGRARSRISGRTSTFCGSPPIAVSRDATIEAVGRIADYDRERGASLLPTLEEFLQRRGSISATSEALFIHANTLRQRLRRIADLSGIDLRRDDWLMIEIAVKLVQLRLALAARRRRHHIFARPTMEALAIVRAAARMIGHSERPPTEEDADGRERREARRRSGRRSPNEGSSSSSPSSSTCTGVRARSWFRLPSLDGLVQEGAGFAGFAAGEIGQLPSDPDIAAIPDLEASRSCRGSRIWPGLPATSRSRARHGHTAPARSSRNVLARRPRRGTSSRSGSSSSTFWSS